jgi:superfamily I DNA/RNA helicase
LKIIIGGPGTGKTERLIRETETELAEGLTPDRIAFVSFTRQAAYGARQRAMDKFGLPEDAFPHFRTLHSMAYKHMDVGPDSVMSNKHYKEIADSIGLQWTGNFDPTAGPATGGPEADRCLAICEYARAKMIPLGRALKDHSSTAIRRSVMLMRNAIKEYKSELGMVDFTDMIEEFIQDQVEIDVEVAFVDEAQDLTPLQWKMVECAFKGRVIVAGDDDQAIYRWSGADVDRFINLEGEREILHTSHRLTDAVFDISVGVARHITKRIAKDFQHSGRKGEVEWINHPDHIDLSSGTWLLMARNGYSLRRWAAIARDQGVIYSLKGRSSIDPDDVEVIRLHQHLLKGGRISSKEFAVVIKQFLHARKKIESREYTKADLPNEKVWYEAFERMPQADQEYLRLCLRNGEKLDQIRIRIDTIHGAKGAEAEQVGLMTDISARTMVGLKEFPDDEHRTFFVGASRASEKLVMVTAQTGSFYFM